MRTLEINSRAGRIPRLAEALNGLPASVANGFSPRAMQLLGAFDQHARTTLADKPVREGQVLIIVPACQERAGIGQTLERLLAAAQASRSSRCSVAVVVNGPDDGTPAAVRAWSASHPQQVVLCDGVAEPEADGSGLRLFLMESQPGKTHALLEPEKLLARSAAIPEYVLQLDADTHLDPGQIDSLVTFARGNDLTAAAGRPRLIDARGEFPHILYDLSFRRAGLPGHEVLAGAVVLSRTRAFFAGFKAIRDVFPGFAGEDLLYSGILGLYGLKIGLDRSVVYDTQAAPAGQPREKQFIRWLTAHDQFNDLFGEAIQQDLGFMPRSGLGEYVALVRDARTPRRLGAAMLELPRMRSRQRAARAQVRAQDPDQPFTWTPPRQAEQPSAPKVDPRSVDWGALSYIGDLGERPDPKDPAAL